MTGQHGGARPGSGPKPKPDAMVTRAFVLRYDQALWLEDAYNSGERNKSELAREAFDLLIKQRNRALDKAMKSAARNR